MQKSKLQLKNRRYLLFSSMMICIGLLVVGSTAKAQDSFGVSITPLIREVTVKPGEEITGTVDITDTSGTTQTLYPLVRDFAPSDDPTSASPKFYEATPDDYAYALSKWVSFDEESFMLGSKKTKSIKYTIKAPADAEPGGHYGAVFVTSQAPDPTGKSEVAINARIGSLILMTVSGDIKTSGEIVLFKPSKKIYAKPPATLKTKIKNTGNIHLKPSGEIKITGWSTTEESLEFNKEGGNILPESEREFTSETKTLSWGRYYAKADLSLQSPTGDKFPFTAVATFWIIPIIPILIGLAILLIIIFFWRKWLKRHDQTLKQELKK